MAFGVDDALALGGTAANLIAGMSQQKSAKELNRRQAQTINLQNQNFKAAQPFYAPSLQRLAANAGLGGDFEQVGEGHYALNPSRAGFGLGGRYGSYEDQLRLKQAESDIAHHTMAGANQLRHQLGGMGIADASINAALARNQQAGDQQFGQFRRGLAINAQQEQERRIQQLLAAMGVGFGQGSQASAGYGQQAALASNAANQAFGGVNNILQNWRYMNALQNHQQGLGGWQDTDEDWQGWGNGNGSGGLGGLR